MNAPGRRGRGGRPRAPARQAGTLFLRARAPAKVNLVLRVGARRPDGYHELRTLMVPLDLADSVSLVVHQGRAGGVSCRVPGRPELDGPENLAARAALAFRRRFGVRDRLDLSLEKRIPVTAGLGGGSSDAAAVLRMLARAYRVRDRAALAEIALEVGSDVPFFLGPGPAWVTGRGERLAPVRLGPLHLVLVYPRHPGLAIRAADAFRWLDQDRPDQGRPIEGSQTISDLAAEARNDLQGPCFRRHPRLRILVGRLVGAGATAAIMSGSGPTVFGISPDREAAGRTADRMVELGPDLEVHVVRTLQRHPGVFRWTSPRSASSRSVKRSSRPT
ncbi:MAG TPA: 4-(cytidine 5'-diphospho)-2-C-methyl-D-erythritol kinase [Anaeromyxobacteraceae bacterium]|nr:4-(cytidine 5'-diphospho)-2-C-methyl-D-erythritol kinase [Anaeromyxobacteraceae bacterium]